jgi:hypothetical protein
MNRLLVAPLPVASALALTLILWCGASASAEPEDAVAPAEGLEDRRVEPEAESAVFGSGEVEREAPERPSLPSGLAQGAVVRVAGVGILLNGCHVLDIREGPAGIGLLALEWTRPRSRTDWLQAQFDRVIAGFGDDLWRAFVELGGGLRQAASGIAVEARVTDTLIGCGSFDLPVLAVETVLGVYDVHEERPLRSASRPLGSGLDTAAPELARILEAGLAALGGGGSTLEVVVEGVTDRTLGCPPWALVSAEVDFNCGSRWGFVDVRYADPALEPSVETALGVLLERRGAASLAEVSRSQVAELRERADRLARRGPYRYRGRFTGEVTLHRGTEAVFLTPVFVVEAVVE